MSQFMEVIEWFDETGQEMAHRYPEKGSGEIKMGAQLVVRENQAAIFFRDGKGLDILGPGRHTLSTMNLPIITKVLSLPWGFTSPFRAEAYFINMKVFTTMKWGTKDPVVFKDSELGMVRLRAFGNFTTRITQPLLFINTIVGTMGEYFTDNIEGYLRDIIVSRLNDFLGEYVDTILDLPKVYDEMGEAVKMRLVDDFIKYGLELIDFFVNSITPPAEVQKMIDERSGMAAVGNLDAFMKFKAAKAMGDAAKSGGGGTAGEGAAAGMGLGVGAGLGMMIPGMMFKSMNQENLNPEQIMQKGAVNCPDCHTEVSLDARFCHRCGHQMVVMQKCPQCEKNLNATAKFCSNCGYDLKAELKCSKCDNKLIPGTKFCSNCGEAVMKK
jgi:membrane protease subunit (stomatin/prohibitin family)